MRTYLIEVFALHEDDKDDFSFHVARDDEYTWTEMVGYLQRLQNAGVIDGWTGNEVDVRTAASSCHSLELKYGDDLDRVEGGYEENSGGGGSDPGYRSAMQDAGRGALLQ